MSKRRLIILFDFRSPNGSWVARWQHVHSNPSRAVNESGLGVD